MVRGQTQTGDTSAAADYLVDKHVRTIHTCTQISNRRELVYVLLSEGRKGKRRNCCCCKVSAKHGEGKEEQSGL